MDAQRRLRRFASHRGERRACGKLARLRVEPGTAEDIAIGVLDDRAADIGSQVVEAVDHGLASLGGSPGECRQSAFAASLASFGDDCVRAYPAACRFLL